MSKDLRIEFKFRNAALLSRLQEKFGEDASVKTMAEGAGVGYGDLCYLLSLTRSPFMTPGSTRGTEVEGVRYTKAAMTLANFLDFADPAVLFPVSLYSIKFPKKYYKDFDSIQLLSFQEAREQKLLPPPETYEENYEALGLKERMGQLLETLTAREAKVLRMRFGLDGEVEHNLGEAAEALKVSRERIRQIEKRAISKLRHPARALKVKAFYTGEEPPPPEPVEFVAELIQGRIQGKVKPEVRETVEVQVRAMPAAPKQLTPEVIAERRMKRRLALMAKYDRLKKIQEYSNRPNERLVYAWDPVLSEFRMLPYSLVVEDNRPDPANDQG